MATNGILILNGLKGADLIIYNLLYLSSNRINLTAGQIAYLTCYHPNTVFNSLKRLEEVGLIKRRRDRRGQQYAYEVKKG